MGGAEAFAYIGPHHDYLVISESEPGSAGAHSRDALINRVIRTSKGYVTERFHFSVRVHDGYNPTDIAILNSEEALLLLRHWTPFSGFAVRLVKLHYGDAVPGAILDTETLAEFRPPWTTDNFEGLAVRASSHQPGMLDIYIVSDDNGNPIQRCLLLKFSMKYDKPFKNPAYTRAIDTTL